MHGIENSELNSAVPDPGGATAGQAIVMETALQAFWWFAFSQGNNGHRGKI